MCLSYLHGLETRNHHTESGRLRNHHTESGRLRLPRTILCFLCLHSIFQVFKVKLRLFRKTIYFQRNTQTKSVSLNSLAEHQGTQNLQLQQEARPLLGGFDQSGSHSLEYWNAWSPVGGTVWKGFGGVALLEEVCPRGRALRLQ